MPTYRQESRDLQKVSLLQVPGWVIREYTMVTFSHHYKWSDMNQTYENHHNIPLNHHDHHQHVTMIM